MKINTLEYVLINTLEYVLVSKWITNRNSYTVLCPALGSAHSKVE